MHHTHIFLSNEVSPAEACSYVNSMFEDTTLYANYVDYADVVGCIDLETGEYTPCSGSNTDTYIKTIEKLENFANQLFSKETYIKLSEDIKKAVEIEDWWAVRNLSKKLDGMKYAVRDNKRWTAKDPFCINDDFWDMCGISDATSIVDPSVKHREYAVIVDFHS